MKPKKFWIARDKRNVYKGCDYNISSKRMEMGEHTFSFDICDGFSLVNHKAEILGINLKPGQQKQFEIREVK